MIEKEKNILLHYKILCLIILGLLIISNYVEITSDETYYSVVINTWWYVGVPTVIVSWVFLVKAVKNFNKDSFWQNLRISLIIRCVLTMVNWFFLQIFISDEAWFYVKGFPIVMAYISLILIFSLKKYKVVDDVTERLPEEPVINIGYILSVIGCVGAVMTGLSSVLRLFSYEGAHVTLMKFGFEYMGGFRGTPMAGSIMPMTLYGWALLAIGIVIMKFSADYVKKENIYILVASAIIIVINIVILNSNAIMYMKYSIETKCSWGAVFMVMGPVLCIISQAGKLLINRRESR